MYICYGTLIHKIHLWRKFFFWWKVVKDIFKTTSNLASLFFENISSLKTGIYLTSLWSKTDKHFVIWVDIGYDLNQCNIKKLIIYWSDVTKWVCVFDRSQHDIIMTMLFIMLFPYSILLFGFKTFIIIWFIAIIQRFFGNSNFPSSKTSLTPLWDKPMFAVKENIFLIKYYIRRI